MVDYHPFRDAIFDDPYPTYKRLRDESPVHYLEEFACWFLSRFEDIWNLEGDQRNLTSKFGTTSTHLVTKQTPTSPNLSGLDPPQHGPVRSYFNPPFKPGAVAALEPRVRAFAREATSAVRERAEADAVIELGGYVASRVVCTILGLPIEDAGQILAWVNTYFEREPGVRGSTPRGIEAAKEFAMYLFRLSKEMRTRGAPEGSLMHKLHHEEIAGERADDMRVAVHLNMLAIGGTETFPKVFSAALSRLAQNPDQRAACARDASLIPDAFHETLRIDMPTQMLGRTIARDFELHGRKLRAGSGLLFLWGSANRDEREFADPDRFDLRRRAPRILSFGHGQHMCLGAHVARLEGRILIEEVLRAMPEYEIDTARIQRLRSEFFRGFAALPIRFAPF
ncbi:MAG: cytochrome P450 [Deltaproteobacteria bacterium]|nr:MAG: cytochrome P450 [Deltaproteobacteria bacterium]